MNPDSASAPAAESADARIRSAQALLRAGGIQAAAEACAEILREDPGNADALHLLAETAFRDGRHAQAIDRLRAGMALNPRNASLPYKLGCLLEEANRPDEALQAYESALRLDPGFAKAHNNLGGLLQNRGRVERALPYFEEARRLEPRLWEPHYNIGNLHKLAGRLDLAVRPYQEAMRRKRALDVAPPPDGPAFTTTCRSKLLHDIEQLGYLIERGVLAPAYRAVMDEYGEALRVMAGAFEARYLAEFPPDLLARVAPTYNRLLNFYDAPELPGPAVNPALDRARIEADYARNEPGLVYVDDLLTPRALQELRRFCLESTVWFDFNYSHGYLGAYVEEGFICPLLAQIARELPRSFPAIFGGNPITHLWAYKYDSSLPGINVHADFAAVNVNFWLTPDAANRSSGTGGLVVWDKEAPADWDFETYNKDAGRIERFLEQTGANAVNVPYRQNRAVIFNSDLFHKTDVLDFRPGYENRRINVTMLYGNRAG